MRSELEKIDWSEVFESDDVEIVCQNVENLILDLTQRFLPARRVFKHKEKIPRSVRRAAKNKRELHKHYQITTLMLG